MTVAVNLAAIANGPAFAVFLGTNQSIPNNAWTKVNLNTESFDTNNNYDNVTNFRFTPTVPGYYQISAQVDLNVLSAVMTTGIALYKNGGSILTAYQTVSNVGNDYMPTANKLVYMNGTTDYLEIFAFQNSGSARNAIAGDFATFFTGYLARGA